MQIHCTKRLSDLLGIAPETNSGHCLETYPLGIWYANIFDVKYDRDREADSYLLMLNTDSLLSMSLSIPEELSTDEFIAELPIQLDQFFKDCDFTSSELTYLKNTQQEVHFTKAGNRSMLGYLRSFAKTHSKKIRQQYRSDTVLRDNQAIVDINRLRRDGLIAANPINTAKQIIKTTLRYKR